MQVGELVEGSVLREHCSKCGAEIYPFSKKYSESSGAFFCVKCAEKADREYLIKNSCSACKRLLKKNEVKIVMPSRVYGDQALPLADRLLCVDCHKKMGTRSMDKRSFRQKMAQIRSGIRKSLMKKAVQKQYVM